eukprot:scaffold13357_cov100-Isochrysis_galbana.AAC.2
MQWAARRGQHLDPHLSGRRQPFGQYSLMRQPSGLVPRCADEPPPARQRLVAPLSRRIRPDALKRARAGRGSGVGCSRGGEAVHVQLLDQEWEDGRDGQAESVERVRQHVLRRAAGGRVGRRAVEAVADRVKVPSRQLNRGQVQGVRHEPRGVQPLVVGVSAVGEGGDGGQCLPVDAAQRRDGWRVG